MTFSRTVSCHYSFMHENLLDMNHQFLHRGVVGRIQPELLGYDTARTPSRPATCSPTPAGRRTAAPACSPAGRRRHRVARRHHHPHRLPLPDAPAGSGERRAPGVLPVGGLRARGRRAADQSRLRPADDREAAGPGVIHLAWPLIRRFTERVFAEDRTAVEAEQRAWDEQGEDRNHEVFPLIPDVRDVLRTNGVPHPPRVRPVRRGRPLRQAAAGQRGATAGWARPRDWTRRSGAYTGRLVGAPGGDDRRPLAGRERAWYFGPGGGTTVELVATPRGRAGIGGAIAEYRLTRDSAGNSPRTRYSHEIPHPDRVQIASFSVIYAVHAGSPDKSRPISRVYGGRFCV